MAATIDTGPIIDNVEVDTLYIHKVTFTDTNSENQVNYEFSLENEVPESMYISPQGVLRWQPTTSDSSVSYDVLIRLIVNYSSPTSTQHYTAFFTISAFKQAEYTSSTFDLIDGNNLVAFEVLPYEGINPEDLFAYVGDSINFIVGQGQGLFQEDPGD